MHRSTSKNNRVLGLIALMALASFAVLGSVYVLATDETDHITAEVARLTELRTMARQLAVAVRDEEASLNAYVLSRSTAAEQLYAGALAIETDTVTRLRVAGADFPASRPGSTRWTSPAVNGELG